MLDETQQPRLSLRTPKASQRRMRGRSKSLLVSAEAEMLDSEYSLTIFFFIPAVFAPAKIHGLCYLSFQALATVFFSTSSLGAAGS